MTIFLYALGTFFGFSLDIVTTGPAILSGIFCRNWLIAFVVTLFAAGASEGAVVALSTGNHETHFFARFITGLIWMTAVFLIARTVRKRRATS